MATVEQIARMEITFIQHQAIWLSAFARGLQQSVPVAAEQLGMQADVWVKEWQAAERLLEEATPLPP